MEKKLKRIFQIKKFLLRDPNMPKTISEIHDGIYEIFQIDVSRRTIQRDVLNLVFIKEIESLNSYPRKYKLSKKDIHQIDLTTNELHLLIKIIEKDNISVNDPIFISVRNKLISPSTI